MKMLKLVLLATCFALVAATAEAGATWTNATVVSLQTNYVESNPTSGYVVVTFSTNGGTPASCATNHAQLVIDTSVGANAIAVSFLQFAYKSNLTIPQVNGTGDCNFWTGYESLLNLKE